MKCADRQALFAYALRQMKGREERKLGGHVAQCVRCREIVEEYAKIEAVLGDWRPVEPSPWFDARVRQRIAESGVKEPSRVWSWLDGGWWSPVRIGGTLVLVTALSVAVIRNHRSSSALSSLGRRSEPPTARYSEPRADQARLRGEEELKLYENLPVLEDYDMLSDFDLLSQLKKGDGKVEN